MRRLQHRRQDAHEFFVAAPRQQRYDRPLRIEIVRMAKLFAITAGANFAGQRVADVFNAGHAARGVPISFKWQNR